MIRILCGMVAASGRFVLTTVLVFAFGRGLSAESMVYTGLVVTDVRVGTKLMHNASVKITFEGDTDDILQVPNTPSTECLADQPYFFYLTKGTARMEIQFLGRTRTATLDNGQIFVALDQCSGGIGFGSFLGPNGPAPAYPLAFTLGTAEYASVTRRHPLTHSISVTGAAWSCLGYPTDPPAGTGNCISPDLYPLTSDIGEIYIYQPYFEYVDIGNPNIGSDHSGTTNRGAFLVRQKSFRADLHPDLPPRARRSGLVYTLRTVADGSIGKHVFKQALVTLQMFGNTESVTSQTSPADPTRQLYENRYGPATVTIDDRGDIISAEFEPGEVFVRYDAGAGVAGFGSRISPTYPISLDCSDSAYPSDGDYTADCLQGDAWNFLTNTSEGKYAVFRNGILAQLNHPYAPSPAVSDLPMSLSQNTLLTGTAHTCAGVYTLVPPNPDLYFPGNLGVCKDRAPRGLRTSKGAFYLQDLEGGTLNLGQAPIVVTGDESGRLGGWDLANSGFLHVEVYKSDD